MEPPALSSSQYLPKSVASAFTLIEVLAIVAIVALLTALLMPTLQSMRESANEAKCVSNLRSIGSAAAMYSAENEGALPYGRFGDTSSCWFTMISVGMTPEGNFLDIPPGALPFKLLNCPSLGTGYNWGDWRNVGYTYNETLGGLRIQSAPAVANVPVAWDGRNLFGSGFYGFGNFSNYANMNRHGRNLNMLFLDGHVEVLSQAALKDETSALMNPRFIWKW